MVPQTIFWSISHFVKPNKNHVFGNALVMEVYKGNIPDNYFVTALCLKHLLIPPKTEMCYSSCIVKCLNDPFSG